MKLLGTATGENFESKVFETSDGKVFFVGDFDVDCDGSGGNPLHDPYFQADTTLHWQGKALNAETTPFMVVPGWLPKSVGPIVLGCLGRATNLATGIQVDCVVGDLGPLKKTGEGSPALAKLLGINPNPNTGGEDNPIILFECWPGKAATIDGMEFELQKA